MTCIYRNVIYIKSDIVYHTGKKRQAIMVLRQWAIHTEQLNWIPTSGTLGGTVG